MSSFRKLFVYVFHRASLRMLPALLLIALFASPTEAIAFTQRVRAAIAEYERKNRGEPAVCATEIRTGREVYSYRAGRPCAPASNQKVLTSAFALARLGADFRFRTSLFRFGSDVVILGDFDPTLGDPHIAEKTNISIHAEFDRWAHLVQRRLGERVGDVVVYDRSPGPHYRSKDWPSNQFRRHYAAPVARLNYHNNCFGVTFRVQGGKAYPNVQPESYLIDVRDLTRVGRKHLWSLRTNDAENRITLHGTIRQTTTEALQTAVDTPPLLAGRVFADRLRRAGVQVTGAVKTTGELPAVTKADLIAATITPLPVAMGRANKQSVNMAAEGIFLRAGTGVWETSGEVMERTLCSAYGVGEENIVVRDGSGLARGNRITPRAMTKVLTGVLKRPGAEQLLESLPIAGKDGTLDDRLTRNPFRTNVRAKTGYILGVSCLSGYILGQDGKPTVAFSILVNDVKPGRAWKAKDLQDAICRALVHAFH